MTLLSEAFNLLQTIISVSTKAVHWVLKKNCMDFKDWYPQKLLDVQDNFALIILNQPLLIEKQYIIQLWNKGNVKLYYVAMSFKNNYVTAILRVTVDGGTMEWLKVVDSVEKSAITRPVPDLVTGDFDSIPAELIDNLRSLGVKIIPTPDQNETDFMKSICCLSQELVIRELKVLKTSCEVIQYIFI
jgi:thiamine pyrophosphokinase